MKKGSTPTLTMNVSGIELDKVDYIQVTLKQDDIPLIVKENADIIKDMETSTIYFKLTQEQTLSLNDKEAVAIQCKFKSGEEVIVSDIVRLAVDEVLNESVI